MHAKDNSIIVITADQNGVIFNRTKNDVLFNGYTNMFDHPALGNHKEDLSAENYSKKILVNIFRTNYTFLKIPYSSMFLRCGLVATNLLSFFRMLYIRHSSNIY